MDDDGLANTGLPDVHGAVAVDGNPLGGDEPVGDDKMSLWYIKQ
jgi:hypothetical protein